MDTKKISFLGLMLSVSLVLSYLENLIPVFLTVPGVKMGIANIITMYILFIYRSRDAFVIMVLRVLISGILFSGFNTVVFGMLGGIMCIALMSLAKKTSIFSVTGISVIGAVSHNIGQIIAAFFIMDNLNIIYYFPVLLISGTISGFIIGLISAILIKRFQNI